MLLIGSDLHLTVAGGRCLGSLMEKMEQRISDFPNIVRILLWMNDLEKNFYRVIFSAGVSYVKCSSTNLTNDEKDFYLSLQSCLLPLRDGGIFHEEPYFFHRFAHQFGYDQGVLEHLAKDFYAFKPWDLSLSFNYRFDYGRKVMLLAESGIERTSPGRILLDLVETSQEATPNPAADEEIIVDHTCPVRSTVDAGSVGSIGQTIGAIEGAALSTTLVKDSTTVVAATQSQENFVFADISIPSLSDLLGSGVGVGERPTRSPLSIRRTSFGSDGGPAPKDADVALGNIASLSDEVKPPRPEGGGVAMVVDLDARGFGGDSSMGQHILAVVISVRCTRARRGMFPSFCYIVLPLPSLIFVSSSLRIFSGIYNRRKLD
ncbi:hypothetical protein ACLOJK_019899 [Asimina triloba]